MRFARHEVTEELAELHAAEVRRRLVVPVEQPGHALVDAREERGKSIPRPAVFSLASLVKTRERLRGPQVVPARPADERRRVLVGVAAGNRNEALFRYVDPAAERIEVSKEVLV